MKRLLAAIMAILVITPALAAAQSQPAPDTSKPTATKPAPRIRAFVDPDVVFKSPKDWADKIRQCDSKETPWRLTCEMYVKAFNALPNIQDVKDKDDYADFVEEEVSMIPCPTNTELDIAGLQGDDVVYFKRNCRPGEKLFCDKTSSLCFASATCGQLIRNDVGLYYANTDSPVGAADGDPGLSNLRASIDDIARRVMIAEDRQPKGAKHEDGKRSFIDRHWPKMVTGGILATVGIAAWKGLFRQTQEVNQSVCVGGACR